MAGSFFFYDLETSGINPRDSRIMQFAGQRTDLELNPIGDPVNILIKLTPDVVPEPDAIMITGITPQSTIADGVTEAEFLQIFYDEIVKPGTIFLGFNTVRFDDEFMRFLHYRNFYDAYEWQWCDDCSRWDMLDVVRMTRALRPEGIEWPFKAEDGSFNSTGDGKPTNRLELLTKMNGLDHEQAHDALSDVTATIAVAKLIRDKQPGLFDYMMECRGKHKVRELVDAGEPFVYASGRYPSDTLHTTIAVKVADAPQSSAYVYDLRYDPAPFLEMTDEQLAEACRWSRDPTKLRLPVKTIKFNRCPAVAPTGVVKDQAVQERLKLDLQVISANRAKLKSDSGFAERVVRACAVIDQERSALLGGEAWGEPETVDGQLYGGDFFGSADKSAMRQVREAAPKDCAALQVSFQDKRLKALFPLFTARNHPQCLSDDQRKVWDAFCRKKLLDGGTNSRLAKYFRRLDELARQTDLTENQRYAVEELQLYGESIIPAQDDDQSDDAA
jgi:exodeoxyribonuclease-1